MPHFDKTISLGNIIAALAMLFGGASVYAVMNERMAKTEVLQATIKDTMDQSDARLEREMRDLKKDIKETLIEIKNDLRELRK